MVRGRVAPVLGDLAVAIEHVGSTAVPGLAAKPIIDLDVVVASAEDIPEAIERLARLGYYHQGDLGIPGREAFRSPGGAPEHHLYLCPQDSPELRRHLAFRDYLRSHPEAAEEYAELKRALAQRFPDRRSDYTAGKAAWIAGILSRAS